jgi:hypothetical protein
MVASVSLVKYLFSRLSAVPYQPHSREQKINFARDLQDRLGILALLVLSAPFRICKLQIPLASRETDPVPLFQSSSSCGV